MSQVVVGQFEAVGEEEVGEAALDGAVEVLRPPKCGDLRMTLFLRWTRCQKLRTAMDNVRRLEVEVALD
jgi:hypothetical protein